MDNWWRLSQITSEWDDMALVNKWISCNLLARVLASCWLGFLPSLFWNSGLDMGTWFSTRDFSSSQTQKKTTTKNKKRKEEHNTILRKVNTARRKSRFAMGHQRSLDESSSCGENQYMGPPLGWLMKEPPGFYLGHV